MPEPSGGFRVLAARSGQPAAWGEVAIHGWRAWKSRSDNWSPPYSGWSLWPTVNAMSRVSPGRSRAVSRRSAMCQSTASKVRLRFQEAVLRSGLSVVGGDDAFVAIRSIAALRSSRRTSVASGWQRGVARIAASLSESRSLPAAAAALSSAGASFSLTCLSLRTLGGATSRTARAKHRLGIPLAEGLQLFQRLEQ